MENNNYALIIANGCPSDSYPFNGLFQYDQSKALAKAGCKIIYAAIDLRSVRRWRHWGIEHMLKDGMEIYIINIPLGRFPHCVLKYCGEVGLNILYNIIEKAHGKPDTIHAHFTDVAELALSLKSRVQCKYIMTEHSSSVNAPFEQMPGWIQKGAAKIYHSYNQVIAVSPSLAKKIKTDFGMEAIFIPNMLDDIFLSVEKQTIHNAAFSFVYTGNLIQRKRPLQCIRSFYNAFFKETLTLNKKQPNIKMIMIGNGKLYNECRDLINTLKINNNVELKGALVRNEIADIFKTSDCFVLPTASETFGVVYIEAMACGLPVIATACGGPEAFVNKSNGLLLPVDDEKALQQAFIYMYQNAGSYNSKQISEDTKREFSSKNVAEKILAVYRD